ncbi:MAG: metallophosphoesterase [Bacteroidales bacterium]|nr:metallophosphoesterase [Bacteroidales bacterium]
MKRFRIILLCLLVSLPALAASPSNLIYGPWVSNVSETGFTVLWVTEKPSLDFVVVAPDDGSAFEKQNRPKYYQEAYGRRVSGRFHSVRIDGLEPGTSYRYRVVGQVIKDDSSPYRISYGPTRQISPKQDASVRTLSSSAAVCRFSVLNDIHYNDARYMALASGIDVPATDFLILNGDIVSYCQEIDTVAKHCIVPIAAQAARLPLIYARGNHEGRGRDFDKFYGLFPTSTGEFWYSFRQGPAAFIVLDAGEDKPDSSHEYAGQADYDPWRLRQTEWLKEAVKDPAFASAPVKICIMHVPTVKFRDSWYSEVWITENWTPILEEAGIDLMLSAHHHKWICSPAGADGKAYPVLVNSNLERMDVEVTLGNIFVKTYDEAGALVHQWEK